MSQQPDVIPTPVSGPVGWGICCPDRVNIYPGHSFGVSGTCERCGVEMPRRVSPRKNHERK